MYATYNQTLALDFGGFPVLVQHLSVDTVPADTLGDLQRQRRLVVSGESRWTPATVDLVPCGDWDSGVRRDSMADPLARLYPVPDAATFQLTQAVLGDRLTREMYVARMHQLLYVEEMARADIVARYNIKVFLDIVDTITSSSANASDSYYAQGGELYAKLNLESELTDDTPAGRLVLQNCRLLWLSSAGAPQSAGRKRRVYEAPIEITKKKCVYLRLSKQCVDELQLKPRTEFEAEVQFLLDRISLCEMHYAVDKLSTPNLVFPDFKVKPPTFDPCDVLDWDPRLNSQQRRAVACVVAPRTTPGVPPVIVVGPFGTGKTFTLAQAMLQVLRQEGTRVLVCTHSNSAADLYVLDYLDKLVHNQPEARPLRVLYQYRFPASMDKRMLQYCLQVPREQQTKSGPWFRAPTKEELEAHRVIITTLSSSKMLLATGIERGFFTHIFVDEAAQAMETECILPLALADSLTRIVLAGDYMQLNPEVYSVFTRERRLHVSLLERLHDLYPDDHPCKVVLCDNYRSHEALVRYTSESFYKRRLVAAATPGPHHILYPLSFFAARGCDVPRDGSTSYVNDEEVNEIRDVVARLVETWPQTWGPRKLSQIAVVTPYFDQVQSIRTALRSRRLNEVKVESVANVQGKEFRAVVLSTVRTRATCLRLERSTPVKEALDFGFLSNAKLLNTAITRAQSLVVVVGDPVSLCSIGACQLLCNQTVDRNRSRRETGRRGGGDTCVPLAFFAGIPTANHQARRRFSRRRDLLPLGDRFLLTGRRGR
ncbi:putative helicase with zinc finger domain [Ixodes scapularis]